MASTRTTAIACGFAAAATVAAAAAVAAAYSAPRRRSRSSSRSHWPAQTVLRQGGAVASGARVLVTGGSQGIGRVVAIELGRLGCSVAVNYKSDAEADAAGEVVREVASAAAAAGHAPHPAPRAVKANVSVGDEVRAMFAQLDAWAASFSSGPSVNVLVCNAGTQSWGRLLEADEAEWDRVIGTNLRGCFLCLQEAARRMARAGVGGRIVCIGSGCNRVPFPMLSSYAASKAGIDALSRCAAVELGPLGITVNVVAPGAVETERTRGEAGDYGGTWAPLTPLRRVGQPEDVARAVAWLASDEANFVTGQTIFVDGGCFMQGPWPYPNS